MGPALPVPIETRSKSNSQYQVRFNKSVLPAAALPPPSAAPSRFLFLASGGRHRWRQVPPSFRSVFIRRGGGGESKAATHVVVAACNGGVRFRSSREGLAILLTCGLQRWRRLSPILFGQVLWRLPRCFIHARFPLHPPSQLDLSPFSADRRVKADGAAAAPSPHRDFGSLC